MSESIPDFLEPHIIPPYREAFREMWANASASMRKDAPDVTLRFCGVRDPFRELRRLFWSGGRNLGKSLVVRKPLVPEKTEQQKKADQMKFVWLEELSDFDMKENKPK